MSEVAELFDGSYPPSVLHPEPAPIPPTGVVAGSPGSFLPPGCDVPATLAALKADPVVGDAGTNKPSAPWTVGQYVVLGDASQASWNGLVWVAGAVPPVEEVVAEVAPEPEPEPDAPAEEEPAP